MDICYYNSQIREELDGATEYIHRAMNEKKDHPNWASYYVKMSSAELEHAAVLVKIFEEDYKILTSKMEVVPDYLCGIHKSIVDMHAEFASKIKYLHEIYESM